MRASSCETLPAITIVAEYLVAPWITLCTQPPVEIRPSPLMSQALYMDSPASIHVVNSQEDQTVFTTTLTYGLSFTVVGEHFTFYFFIHLLTNESLLLPVSLLPRNDSVSIAEVVISIVFFTTDTFYFYPLHLDIITLLSKL